MSESNTGRPIQASAPEGAPAIGRQTLGWTRQ